MTRHDLRYCVRLERVIVKKKKKKKKSSFRLPYPTTTGFQWEHLKNGSYTYYTVSSGNGREKLS